ncbi:MULTISPECIES: hypothetical protein [Streptomyces]|uniref:hypothetical protein n=1 Tax=Streptomyces TaxID=1883 RepID=UPI0029673716|nr:hypothetical protein [Streptomyces sp. SCL15-6]
MPPAAPPAALPAAASATTTPGDHTQPDTALLPAAARTDCWALPVPLHLARLNGEAAEEHILRGLD